jgi:hypothetical protein
MPGSLFLHKHSIGHHEMTGNTVVAAFASIVAWWSLAAGAVLAQSATNDVQGRPPGGPALKNPAATVAAKSVRFDIPDTGQEWRRPNSGWCGEASIQMALSYYGAYASQQAINRAGKPAQPDLYDTDLPVAMKAVGLEFKPWVGTGLKPFFNWVRAELAAGHPVIMGMKINPTIHPDWRLDHFVLAVGSTEDALIYNTTWNRRETRSLTLLSTQGKGLSLANPDNTYFGCAITGSKLKPPQPEFKPTRVIISRDGDKAVELRVSALDLVPGKRYRLMKFTDLAAAQQPMEQGELVRSFVADGPKAEFVEKIAVDDVRVYHCVLTSER